jgi:predicted NAD-dependent protein-ADP-ribosyltransferase YbiA (DUF1768 family)
MSDKFVWQNIGLFPTSQERICGVCGPSFNTAEQYVVSTFENFFDIALMQVIVDEKTGMLSEKN